MSRQSRVLAFVLFWFIRPLFMALARGPRVVAPMRRVIDALSATPEAGSVVIDGPGGEWVRGPGVPADSEQVILYLHGSGYVICSPRTHRGLVAQLSKRAGMPAFSVDYRLAPEHPFPAAFDDMVAAYKYLLERGYEGHDIIVAGDSAGGHLAISLVAALTEAELPVPAGLILFSPLVDPSFDTAAAIEREARDPAFTPTVAKRFLKLYTDGGTPEDARLAVLHGDAAQMPPVLLHAGSREMLRADADALAAWLRAEHIRCDYTVWPGQIHVFQMFYAWLPEARAALREAGEFARACSNPQPEMIAETPSRFDGGMP